MTLTSLRQMAVLAACFLLPGAAEAQYKKGGLNVGPVNLSVTPATSVYFATGSAKSRFKSKAFAFGGILKGNVNVYTDKIYVHKTRPSPKPFFGSPFTIDVGLSLGAFNFQNVTNSAGVWQYSALGNVQFMQAVTLGGGAYLGSVYGIRPSGVDERISGLILNASAEILPSYWLHPYVEARVLTGPMQGRQLILGMTIGQAR